MGPSDPRLALLFRLGLVVSRFSRHDDHADCHRMFAGRRCACGEARRMILTVRDLTNGFDRGDRTLTAVDGLSFDVEAGETFVIIGESGSGKSLTGMSIAGLQPETATTRGSIRFNGRELLNQPDRALRQVRGREIGLIYQ